MIVYYIISWVIFIYLAFNVSYLLLFAIGGLLRKKKSYTAIDLKKRIAVLIPTYNEDLIIVETAKSAMAQNYPSNCFDVVIIADQLQEDTLKSLSALSINVVKVDFDKSTKAKSLKYAIQQLPNCYEIVVILDADNIMEKGCLDKVNHAFDEGFQMVQLHRTAKNRNTPTAILDAASEEINNHIFRKGHRALGLSSAPIGSGMAFQFAGFKSLMLETNIEDNPGEDREIYQEFLKKNQVCEYIDDALVYDEKVQSGRVLEKQRTRWISAQLQYAKRFWVSDFLGTFSYNVHYFDNAIQTLLLPRILLLVCILLIGSLSLGSLLAMGVGIFPGTIYWFAIALGCILSLTLSVYPYISAKELFGALIVIPQTCWVFIRALLKSRADQKEFIHTPKEFIHK